MSTNPAYKTSFSKGINLQQVPEERSSAASTVAIEALKHCRSEPSSPGLELKYRHIHGEASNLTLPSDAIDNWFEILNSSLEAATAAALQRLDASRIDQPSVFLRIVKDTVKYWTPRFTDAQESLNTPFERNCEDLIKALVQRHPGYVRESFILALSDAGFDIGTL
ncbi:MAG: hypothetical protein FJZ63_03505, partial [Chlamydiae bacterium]|nr:hypothetical protein [Chlamydiota bacterium]